MRSGVNRHAIGSFEWEAGLQQPYFNASFLSFAPWIRCNVIRSRDYSVARAGNRLNFPNDSSVLKKKKVYLKVKHFDIKHLFCVSFCKTFNCCWWIKPWIKISRLHKNGIRFRAVCVQNRAAQFWINWDFFLMEIVVLTILKKIY